jgi:hypothetical protein
MRFWTIAAAALLLAGCKADYVGEGSIRAALAAAAGQDATMTGVIGIEASTEKECRAQAPVIAEALAREYPGTVFLGCTRRNLDTMAEFRVALPVLPAGTERNPPLSVRTQAENGGVSVGLFFDSAAVERVSATLPKDLTRYFDGKFDIRLTIDVRNDTDQTVTVETMGAFVDGLPLPNLRRHDLAPGQILRVEPSDVQRSALAAGSGAFIFRIATAP